jgi:hypothetical protein
MINKENEKRRTEESRARRRSRGREGARTREIPGIRLVEVDLGDDGHGQLLPRHLPAEVVHHELLVGGVEPEPRRQVELRLRVPEPAPLRRRRHCHPPPPPCTQSNQPPKQPDGWGRSRTRFQMRPRLPPPRVRFRTAAGWKPVDKSSLPRELFPCRPRRLRAPAAFYMGCARPSSVAARRA